jgi:hypothetical protein
VCPVAIDSGRPLFFRQSGSVVDATTRFGVPESFTLFKPDDGRRRDSSLHQAYMTAYIRGPARVRARVPTAATASRSDWARPFQLSGQVLRRLSIDELPQLWNVIRAT